MRWFVKERDAETNTTAMASFLLPGHSGGKCRDVHPVGSPEKALENNIEDLEQLRQSTWSQWQKMRQLEMTEEGNSSCIRSPREGRRHPAHVRAPFGEMLTVTPGACLRVWRTTQYRSVSLSREAISPSEALVFTSNIRRID